MVFRVRQLSKTLLTPSTFQFASTLLVLWDRNGMYVHFRLKRLKRLKKAGLAGEQELRSVTDSQEHSFGNTKVSPPTISLS